MTGHCDCEIPSDDNVAVGLAGMVGCALSCCVTEKFDVPLHSGFDVAPSIVTVTDVTTRSVPYGFVIERSTGLLAPGESPDTFPVTVKPVVPTFQLHFAIRLGLLTPTLAVSW